MSISSTVYHIHYRGSFNRRAIYIRKSLLASISIPPEIVLELLLNIRDNPLSCGQETIPYIYGANIHVLYKKQSYVLYRLHQPSSGSYAGYQWIVHVLDIDGYIHDDNGNRILNIYQDPDAIRTLAERDGEIFI